MESFKKYFWNIIKYQYVNFKGLATREEYWMFFAWKLIFAVLCTGPLIIIGNRIRNNYLDYYSINLQIIILLVGIIGLVSVVILIVSIIPSIAILVRRLHDSGKSGWWYFLILIPYVGALIIFIFTLLPSKIEDNKYRGTRKSKKIENEDINSLDKLFKLKQAGAISEEEYNTQKEKLLK